MASDYLDPQLRSLLDSLRHRVRRYIVWDSLLALTALVLGAFWLGLAIDYLPVMLGGTEMPRSARIVLLVAFAVVLAVLFYRLFLRRMLRRLPDDSLALLLERQHPQLEGRLITSVQLSSPGREGDAHAPKLLQRVYQEALSRIDQVDPGKVLRRKPLIKKTLIVAPLVVITLVLVLLTPGSFTLAASRLLLFSDQAWPRRASLEMVGLEVPRISASEEHSGEIQLVDFEEGVARLPRGAEATLRIRAATEPYIVPDVCTLYYQGEEGLRGQANLRRVGRIENGFQTFMLDGPPLSSLTQDLSLMVQGLDDRLDNFRIEVAEPPAITELQVHARYPDYLREPGAGENPDLVRSYQPGLRLREGSDVELIGIASKPLGELDLQVLRDDQPVKNVDLQISSDGKQFALTLSDLREPTTVIAVPIDRETISGQSPYRYFLGVAADAPPEIEIRLRGIGTAVTPMARLPIEGRVEDDYRLALSDLRVSEADGQKPQSASVPIDPDRNGRFQSELDLRDLVDAGRMPELSVGEAIVVFGEATDDYDLGEPHVARSEIFRLELVSPEDLLSLLERRELGLRARLEQTIDETRSLGDTLESLLRESFARPSDTVAVLPQDDSNPEEPLDRPDPEKELERRAEQVLRLRIQQAGLQASKASEELTGIANSIDDILAEMVNNRVDSVDRRERLNDGVGTPLRQVVDGPLSRLIQQIASVEEAVGSPDQAAARCTLAVETNEVVLLRLTAILEKMLDLESYNEILDMVRDLIDNQEDLIEETEKERKQRVLDLFK
ncbi:MAG: polyketide synthase [Pirellulaceae bacterium]